MKTGIIILNYNSHALTCNLIKNCLKIEVINKIVVVDNSTISGNNDYLKIINNNKVKYIETMNNGYAAGNNLGLKYLYDNGYDYAFIANPDVIINSSCINNILDFLNKNENYAVASCKRTQNGTKKCGQFWWLPGFFEEIFTSTYLFRCLISKHIIKKTNYIVSKNENINDYIDVDVVGGAFFGCNLDIMNSLGYFDENTFLFYEENILSTKLKNINRKEALLLNCTYEHNHKKNGRGNRLYKTYFNSKKYYCTSCLRINVIQKFILNIFIIIGKIEDSLILAILNRNKKEEK